MPAAKRRKRKPAARRAPTLSAVIGNYVLDSLKHLPSTLIGVTIFVLACIALWNRVSLN